MRILITLYLMLVLTGPVFADTVEPTDIAYLTGRFKAAQHPDFVKVSRHYASRPNMWLRREAYEAFRQMHAAAAQEGIKLTIRSATRNFYAQKWIWEAKWKGKRKVEGQRLNETLPNPGERALKILEYSAMPGASRHHWGTDIDLNAFNNEYFESGEGLSVYLWLQDNAPHFGFCQTYSAKGEQRSNGYNEEKWHWSYMPLSAALTRQAGQLLDNTGFGGFDGALTASAIDILNNYVLAIDPACLKNAD